MVNPYAYSEVMAQCPKGIGVTWYWVAVIDYVITHQLATPAGKRITVEPPQKVREAYEQGRDVDVVAREVFGGLH